MANASRPSGAYKNALLQQLSTEQIERLQLQPVQFKARQVLYEADQPIEYSYFVEVGMVSVTSDMENGDSAEIGTIGREGLAGVVVVLGPNTVPYKYFVQMAGSGYRLSTETLKAECARSDFLRSVVLHYQAAFLATAMQGAACNALHSVAQRCCRWLLMSQDRIDGDVIPLTHEFLALMLGVRRASVSEVLRPLHEKGWLKSQRGEITVLNRKGLESGSCECYGRIAKQYERMVA
jgi:CRP-like cAMP-binding protein